MKVDLMTAGMPLRSVQQLARDASEAGFAGLVITEAGRTPYLSAAAAALATDLDILTGIAVAFPRSPMVTAQIAWELAEVSDGRFRLGLGTQVRAHIERRYGVEFDPPGPRMLDYLLAVRACFAAFRTGELSHHGEYYDLSLLPSMWSPGPISAPDPPIDLAAVNPWMLRFAGAHSDVVQVHPRNTSPYLRPTVMADPAEGYTIGDGIKAMDRIAEEVLDDSFSTSLAGVSKEFAESGSSIWFALGLALVLIFLILAAQFESWLDPLVVICTVPLALAGALLSLWIGGHTINIFSQIGGIVLIGLVTKNGILIVEFANQRREAGLKKLEAVVDAAGQRFRPILMTSLATVLGVLPIALGLGAAAKSRVPMGIAIIGGLLFALLLTVYVVPALYSYMSREKKGAHGSALPNGTPALA